MASEYSQAFLEEYIGYRLKATAAAFIAINTLFVGLRLLAQYIRPAPFGWDDIWTVLAWAVIMVECSAAIWVVEQNAIGYHIVAQLLYRPDKIALWGKWCLYVIPALYVVASTLPKFSILALYLRIFIGKWVRRACWATIAILAIAMIVNFFTVVFQCNPRAKGWTPSLPGTCNNIEAHFRYSALPNLFTDVIMLVIPIPTTINLQCSMRTKIAIVCTFLLGSLGLVTGLFRMITFFTTTSIPIPDGGTIADSTWDGNLETIWIVVEPSVYLISACLLSCRSLINYLINDLSLGNKASSIWNLTFGRFYSPRSSSNKSENPSEGFELGGKGAARVKNHPLKPDNRHSAALLSAVNTKGSTAGDQGDRLREQSKGGPKAESTEQIDPYETV